MVGAWRLENAFTFESSNLKIMRPIIYYVATSLDGFIAGPDDNIDGFVPEGSGVERYLADLAGFDTVIMGRRTYEFGYRFGLQPGQPAYPHMAHFIFSRTLRFENPDARVQVVAPTVTLVRALKEEPGTPIYLCGGGELVGWLLDHELIDFLKIKLNPLILGTGISLFGRSEKKVRTELLERASYDHGLEMLNYRLRYDC